MVTIRLSDKVIDMKYFIKEWSDNTATLIAEDGYALEIYNSVDEAIDACVSDCMVEPDFIESHENYLGASPIDFDNNFIETH